MTRANPENKLVNDGAGMEFGMYWGLAENLTPLQMWQYSPFEMLGENGVVLRNLTVSLRADKEALNQETTDLKKSYFCIRRHIIQWGAAVVSIIGDNQAGKSQTEAAFYTLLNKDQYLLRQLQLRGYDRLDTESIPFAHCSEAAKLEELGLVAPDLTPSTYGFENEHRISGLQWDLVLGRLPEGAQNAIEVSEALKQQRVAKAILTEGSRVLSLPTNDSPPVRMDGPHDLGTSTVFNAAFDPRTNKHLFLLTLQKDPRLEENKESDEFRDLVFAEEFDPAMFTGTDRIMVERDGQLVDAGTLPLEEQKKIAVILSISMAPRKAAVLLAESQADWLNLLKEKGDIPEASTSDLYELIRKRARLPKKQYLTPFNKVCAGKKDLLLGYLENSLVLRKHPKILDQATRRRNLLY